MAKRRRGGANSQVRRGNRVFFYVRISDTRGREDTLISDDMQIDTLNRLSARENLECVDIIIEKDKSGRESERRRIAELINRVEAGEADGIAVWKVSRWGRNTIDSMLNIGELQAVGGFIVSATESLDDIDTPHGKFSLTVLLAIAQLYSDEIGKTWASIHDLRRGLGKTAHGTPRLGYVRENDEYTPCPVTGPWVRKAFEFYIGGGSLNTIVGEMRDAGVTSHRRKRNEDGTYGEPFSLSYNTLLSNMDNGFAAGLIVDRREAEAVFHKGTHEPLIDMDTWEAYQRRRAEKVPPRTKSAPYRLARLLRCGTCGAPLHVTWQVARPGMPRRRVFKCNRRAGTFQRQVDRPAPAQIDERFVEEAVLAWLKEQVEGDEALSTQMARAARVDQAKVDVAEVERKIVKMQRRLSVLADKVIDGAISNETAREKEEEIRAEIVRLRARLEQTETVVRVNEIPALTAFEGVLAGWELLDPALLNEALRMVIRDVVVTKNSVPRRRAYIKVRGAWEADLQAVS